MNAVQTAVTWRKSARSNPSGNCVELAALPGGEVAVRDSKDPHGGSLVFSRAQLAAFVERAKIR